MKDRYTLEELNEMPAVEYQQVREYMAIHGYAIDPLTHDFVMRKDE